MELKTSTLIDVSVSQQANAKGSTAQLRVCKKNVEVWISSFLKERGM